MTLHRIRYVCNEYDAGHCNSQGVKVTNMMQSPLGDYTVRNLSDWEKRVQTLLKVELTKRNLTYKQLSEKLAEIGVSESEPNIRNKLSRGSFSAVFLIQCLEAIGADLVSLKS